jgi:transposase InsO family protein
MASTKRRKEAREARRQADETLAHEITVIHLASRKNYGVPRVTAALRRQGRAVNHKRAARIMREHRIAGNSRRTRRRSLTRADTQAAWSPDLIGRDFTAARPGTRIVGDITYIPTVQGWLYLASWLYLATRGRLVPGCVIHSDHGSDQLSSNNARSRQVARTWLHSSRMSTSQGKAHRPGRPAR